MNYRDLSLKMKVDLKLIAPLDRGRAVTRSRLEPSTYMPWMLDSSTLEARYGHVKIHMLTFHELS